MQFIHIKQDSFPTVSPSMTVCILKQKEYFAGRSTLTLICSDSKRCSAFLSCISRISTFNPEAWWCVCVLSYSGHAWLFATPRAAVHQAPLSMWFCRQEHWGGLPRPPPGDLPYQGTEPMSLTSAWTGGFFTTSTTWEVPPRGRWHVCAADLSHLWTGPTVTGQVFQGWLPFIRGSVWPVYRAKGFEETSLFHKQPYDVNPTYTDEQTG